MTSDRSSATAPLSIVAQVEELERIVGDVRATAARYGNHPGDAFAGETIFTDLQLALGPQYALRSLGE